MDKGFNGCTAKCQVQQKSHVWNKPSVPGFVAPVDWPDDERFIASRTNKIRNFNYDPCTSKRYFWWIGKWNIIIQENQGGFNKNTTESL